MSLRWFRSGRRRCRKPGYGNIRAIGLPVHSKSRQQMDADCSHAASCQRHVVLLIKRSLSPFTCKPEIQNYHRTANLLCMSATKWAKLFLAIRSMKLSSSVLSSSSAHCTSAPSSGPSCSSTSLSDTPPPPMLEYRSSSVAMLTPVRRFKLLLRM